MTPARSAGDGEQAASWLLQGLQGKDGLVPEKLKVLFLPHPVREDMFYPWGVDVVNAVRATGNDIEVCDYKAELAPQFAGVDVVIDVGGSAGTEEMADLGAGQVRLWQILGTGLDHFEMDVWRSRGIPVANCPGQFSSVALAEHAMMMILLLAREYPRSQTNLRTGVFYEPVGQELEGKRLVLYGFGASGIELAKRARGFGMRLFAIDIREVSDEEREELGVEFAGTPEDLDGCCRKPTCSRCICTSTRAHGTASMRGAWRCCRRTPG